MKNDKKIEQTIRLLRGRCTQWLASVESTGNQDAWSDRGVEEILDTAAELKNLYENNKED